MRITAAELSKKKDVAYAERKTAAKRKEMQKLAGPAATLAGYAFGMYLGNEAIKLVRNIF